MPISPHGVSKLIADQYRRGFSAAYGVGDVAVGYFSVFGPRQEPGSQYSGVIPRFPPRAGFGVAVANGRRGSRQAGLAGGLRAPTLPAGPVAAHPRSPFVSSATRSTPGGGS